MAEPTTILLDCAIRASYSCESAFTGIFIGFVEFFNTSVRKQVRLLASVDSTLFLRANSLSIISSDYSSISLSKSC